MLYVVRKAEVRVRAHPAVVEGKYRWVHDYYRRWRSQEFEGDVTPIVAQWPVVKHKKDIEDYVDLATKRWSDKYKVVVTNANEIVEGSADQMVVALSLYDKPGPNDDPESMFFTGERAEVKVSYFFDNQVLHIDSAFLSDMVQGQGMGTDIVHHAIEYGLAKGIKEISLVADGTTGVYSWARMGFDFASEGTPGVLNKPIIRKMKDSFRQYCWAQYKHVVQPKDIEHSWQLANYEIGGIKAGKRWMLGFGEKYSYYASMDLEAYRNWKKEKGLEKSLAKAGSSDYTCPYDGLSGIQLRRFKQGAFWVREFRCPRGHVWQRVQ